MEYIHINENAILSNDMIPGNWPYIVKNSLHICKLHNVYSGISIKSTMNAGMNKDMMKIIIDEMK
jgi:hypothetical protein